MFVVVVGIPSAAVAAMSLQRVPYYAIEPGSASSVGDLLQSSDVTLYEAEGEVLYTTVRTHRMSRFEKWRYDHGWLDDTVRVVSAKDLLGDQTPDENRAENLKVMGFSKDTATYVALRKLGYEPVVSGGGVVVTQISEEAPANTVLDPGHIIVAVDGKPTPLDVDLRAIISARKPGDEVSLTITNNDGSGRRDVTTELTQREDGTTIIGIATDVPSSISFRFPIDLEIDTDDVGGPSAGLAFTLGTLDALTPGELTGGKKIAVTGTINFSGDVGNIGGIVQKASAVKRAGADVFIVPADEAEDARAGLVGDDVEVIGVRSLDEALEELAKLGGNSLALGTPGRA